MDIKIICVGKIKEEYFNLAINEYKKRLKPFCNFELIEVKEVNTDDEKKNIISEGKNIIANIKKQDYIITLEIEGENLDSISFAKYVEKHYLYNDKKLTFIIGGSNGLSDEVKSLSNFKLSFSHFTFPHQLMRVILLEQIYRVMMINNNQTYHK